MLPRSQSLRFILRHSSPSILSNHPSHPLVLNPIIRRCFGKKRGKGRVIFNTAPGPSFQAPPEEIEELTVPPNEYLDSLVLRKRKERLNSEEDKLWLIHRRYKKRSDRLNSDQRHLVDLFSVASDDNIPSLSRLRRALEYNGLLRHAVVLEARVASLLASQNAPIDQARSYQRAADLAKDLGDFAASQRWYNKASTVCRDALTAQAEEVMKAADRNDDTVIIGALDLYEAALAQCLDDTETIPLQEKIGELLVRLGKIDEALGRYELALQHAQALAERVVEEETCLPKDAPLVENLGPRIVRLRELVRTTTDLLAGEQERSKESSRGEKSSVR